MRLGRLGLRRRASRVRRAVRAAGDRVRRPDAGVMRALGDKIEAKRLAERAGVPVAPWSGGPVESVEDARAHRLRARVPADDQGRGGRRRPRHAARRAADEVANAFERARAEAEQAFGDPSVLMERLVEGARHVEVQLIADGQGTVWALGVRDCSYQRRHQKVVEESASPVLRAEQERELARVGRRARPERRLPRRRHGRVPLRARVAALLLHGGQRPPPGRAPGDRDRHRRRPRHASSCTWPPAAGSRATRRRRPGTRSRCA